MVGAISWFHIEYGRLSEEWTEFRRTRDFTRTGLCPGGDRCRPPVSCTPKPVNRNGRRHEKLRRNGARPGTQVRKNRVGGTPSLNAQVGIRIRVDAVTGHHDRPLHYLGSFGIITQIPPPGVEPGTSR